MTEVKKEVIIIPSIKKFIQQKKASLKKNSYNIILILIFIMFLVLLCIVTFLPVIIAIKIIALVIGSFIIEDIHHSFKKLCQTN